MTNADLQKVLTTREIVAAYGSAIHAATTLEPPPSVRLYQGMTEGQPMRRSLLLKRAAVRIIAWFG